MPLFDLYPLRAATCTIRIARKSANYKIGPSVRLVLILTGDVELAHTRDVTHERFTVIPQVGQLSVANLTLAQLESLLYDRFGRVYSGVRRGGGTTRFSISVAKFRNDQLFVVGDFEHPGSIRVSSAASADLAMRILHRSW